MDRKAFLNCGAVLVSLGAVFSVGCGAPSASPSTSAPTASLGVATEREQQAVIVSRSEASLDAADNAPTEDVLGTPVEIVAIDPEPVDTSFDAVPVAAEAATAEPLEEPATEETIDAYASHDTTSDEQLPPAPEALTPEPVTTSSGAAAATEIRFASPSAAQPAKTDDDKNASEIQIVTQGEPAPADRARRELTPLTITPRGVPQTEQEAFEPPVVESPLVAEQPVAVVPAPGLEPAPVANESPATESGAAEETPLVAEQPAATAAPTPLPPVPVARSAAMTAAMARVHERVRHGIQLADKGALYASRKEFTTAVKMVAQAQDVEHVTRRHTRAVIDGFVALKEANEFVRQNAELGDLNVTRVVARHKTQVLKDEDVSDMPPTVAAGYYFNYAKDQLAIAVGNEANGSIALYGLGKIILAGAGNNSRQLEYTGPAIALFQAAIVSEPQNFRAAHELGVLLASSGQLEMARELLKDSVAKSSQPLIWQNLAKVHARLGEQQLAQRAQQNAAALQQANPESKAPPVEWVDPAVFATTVSATDTVTPPPTVHQNPTNSGNPATAPAQPQKKENVAKKRLDKWNPLNLRR